MCHRSAGQHLPVAVSLAPSAVPGAPRRRRSRGPRQSGTQPPRHRARKRRNERCTSRGPHLTFLRTRTVFTARIRYDVPAERLVARRSRFRGQVERRIRGPDQPETFGCLQPPTVCVCVWCVGRRLATCVAGSLCRVATLVGPRIIRPCDPAAGVCVRTCAVVRTPIFSPHPRRNFSFRKSVDITSSVAWQPTDACHAERCVSAAGYGGGCRKKSPPII